MDDLIDLQDRLRMAIYRMDETLSERNLDLDIPRILGKIDGLRVALSYVDEAIRVATDPANIAIEADRAIMKEMGWASENNNSQDEK